jgi:predicted nucleic acid-binding protein
MTNELFFDTDCLSAFLWINDTNLLEQLYGGKIVIPGPVYQELSNPSIPHIKRRADALLNKDVASVKQIDTDKEEYKLYRILVKGNKTDKAIGKGEAAGIALAKTYSGILASNNWKDIALYIDKYDLKHIDTGIILIEGLEKGLITEDQGNTVWEQMLNKNRMLPEKTFSNYLKKYKK